MKTMDLNREAVTMAAIKVGSSMFTGHSHIEAASEAEKALPHYVLNDNIMETGFLTNKGRFVSPSIAYQIARLAGQVEDKEVDVLVSEDIHPGRQFIRR
jgi:hypothetical protein